MDNPDKEVGKMNPLTGRTRFRLRTLENCLRVLAIFTVGALLFSQFPLPWLWDLLLIGLLFVLFFCVWEHRTIGLSCPHCRKYIATNTPWVCGFCEKDNRFVVLFPFVHRCEHCTAEAKAYKCHHRGCGKLIFLSEDQSETNFARCIGPIAVEEPAVKSDYDAVREQREEEKRSVEHELILTELRNKLSAAKEKTSSASKEKSPFEKKKESFERHYADSMYVQEIAREKKRENAIKYRNDLEMLKRANEAVDDWVVSET